MNIILDKEKGLPAPMKHERIGIEARAVIGKEAPAVPQPPVFRDARSLAPRLPGIPCIESAHPSPLSAHNGFFGSRPFSRANALLTEAGADPVDWRLP